jgi:hypothetical protein
MPMRCLRDACQPIDAQRRDPPCSVPSESSQHLLTAQSVGFIAAVLVLLAAFWGSNACQTASAAKNLYNTGYSPFSSCCVTRWFGVLFRLRLERANALRWNARLLGLTPHAGKRVHSAVVGHETCPNGRRSARHRDSTCAQRNATKPATLCTVRPRSPAPCIQPSTMHSASRASPVVFRKRSSGLADQSPRVPAFAASARDVATAPRTAPCP